VFDLRIDDFIHNEHGPIDAGITSVAREKGLPC
jgi:glucose repression regulatory protein TUP1